MAFKEFKFEPEEGFLNSGFYENTQKYYTTITTTNIG